MVRAEQPMSEETPAAFAAVEEQPDPALQARGRGEPVLVTGAAGFVGRHTCRELVRRGWKVRALVRHRAKAERRLAGTDAELVEGDLRDPAALDEAVRGTAAIVHLAAIAIERPGQRYEDVNTAATIALLDAARRGGVDRLVHMSQNGASSDSPYRFLRSKGIAEDRVRGSGLRWTVLRPSVIFGPEDEFVNVLARLVRLSPGIYPVPGGGVARFQPVAVDDVARVVAASLEAREAVGRVYPLGGPAALTLRQMVERVLLTMNAKRLLVGIPVSVVYPIVALAQRLLPNPPVTTSLLDLLNVDNTVGESALWSEFGITPIPFAPEELTYLRGITFTDAVRSLFG